MPTSLGDFVGGGTKICQKNWGEWECRGGSNKKGGFGNFGQFFNHIQMVTVCFKHNHCPVYAYIQILISKKTTFLVTSLRNEQPNNLQSTIIIHISRK